MDCRDAQLGWKPPSQRAKRDLAPGGAVSRSDERRRTVSRSAPYDHVGARVDGRKVEKPVRRGFQDHAVSTRLGGHEEVRQQGERRAAG